MKEKSLNITQKISILVGEKNAAKWLGELSTFLFFVGKDRDKFICKQGSYKKLFPILGVSGKEKRPYSDEEINRLLNNPIFLSVKDHFEKHDLFPMH